MNRTVEVELDEESINKACALYALSHTDFHPLRIGRNLLPAILLVPLAWLSEGTKRYVGFGIAAVALVIALLDLFMRWRYYAGYARKSLTYLDQMAPWRFQHEFTEEGVHSRSQLGDSFLPWTGFRAVLRSTQVWLLYVTDEVFVILPVKQVPKETRDYICEQSRAKGLLIGGIEIGKQK